MLACQALALSLKRRSCGLYQLKIKLITGTDNRNTSRFMDQMLTTLIPQTLDFGPKSHQKLYFQIFLSTTSGQELICPQLQPRPISTTNSWWQSDMSYSPGNGITMGEEFSSVKLSWLDTARAPRLSDQSLDVQHAAKETSAWPVLGITPFHQLEFCPCALAPADTMMIPFMMIANKSHASLRIMVRFRDARPARTN